MARVLIIDDEPGVCWALQQTLEGAGHEVDVAGTAEQGLPRADEADLVFLDIGLPGMDGLQALGKLPGKPVVIITAHGTLDNAVEAMQKGAFDYLVKPLRSEEIPVLVERALRRTELEQEVGRLRDQLGASTTVVGASRRMQDLFKQIATVALSDAPVRITGEAGAGRTLVARALHRASARRDAPCVVVEGRFLPSDLPVDGSLVVKDPLDLTDADRTRLLRSIEAGDGPRVMTTSGEPLPDELAARVGGVSIHVPPLRERRADIPLLVAHFLEREFRYDGGVGTATMTLLEGYDWPGNVRELRHAIEVATVQARGAALVPEHFPPTVREVREADDDDVSRVVTRLLERIPDGRLHELVQESFERALLEQVLQATGGNQVQSAKRLGIHRTTLRKLMDRYGLG
ncbi:MAG: sigma-54 dependent transcriptional regulator [Planctomycetota bacterium]